VQSARRVNSPASRSLRKHTSPTQEGRQQPLEPPPPDGAPVDPAYKSANSRWGYALDRQPPPYRVWQWRERFL